VHLSVAARGEPDFSATPSGGVYITAAGIGTGHGDAWKGASTGAAHLGSSSRGNQNARLSYSKFTVRKLAFKPWQFGASGLKVMYAIEPEVEPVMK
jgi:hypothetical protein